MNPDREPNRLPLRAGAMVLIAVAIIFVALGWHSAATSGSDPDSGLAAASSSPSPTTAPAATSTANTARVCVINAGSISGLATEVTKTLKTSGFRTASPSNYDGGSFTENTILYDDAAQKAQAKRVAAALGGDASVEERPSAFTMCRTGIPVVVVTR
ncbi:MAG: LytR C-terminal domain-containing protein [Gordonia sp. (in: high G+C Gram-positive bacteria)]